MLLRFLLLLLPFTALVACGTRGPGSRFVPAPADPMREVVATNLTEITSKPEMQLPKAGDYYIGPGDVLGIALVGRPDVFGSRDGERFQLTVTESPFVTLPYVGAVRVHGRTAAQFQEELRAAYTPFVQNPVPVVTIEKFYYNQFTVVGAVKLPGRYKLEVGDTLLDAIFRAGGLTMGRDTGGPPPGRYMKIYREKIGQKERAELPVEELIARLTEESKVLPRREVVIPIEDFINRGQLEYNIPLQSNDIVYIPAAGTVMIQGRVREPGVVFLGPSIRTLTQAVTERGGMRFGGASRIEVVRQPTNGDPVSYYLPGRRMLARKEEDFLLQDGDQIFVHRHPVRATLEDAFSIVRGTISAGASATYNPAR